MHMLRKVFQTGVAALTALAVSTSSLTAGVAIRDLTEHSDDERGLLLAALSNGRLALYVQTDDPDIRDLATQAVAYFTTQYENQTGEEIVVGLAFVESPDGLNSNDAEIRVYADRLPANGFIFRDYQNHGEDQMQLGQLITQNLFTAWQNYIQTLDTAAIEPEDVPNAEVN